MMTLNLLESSEAEEFRRRCQNFVVIGVPLEREIDFLGLLIDFRRICLEGEQCNYFNRIDDGDEPRMMDFLREKKPDLVLLSTVFNQGVFYRVRQVIGEQTLLIGTSVFGVDEKYRAILLEYANGIIERPKASELMLRHSKSMNPYYFEWLLRREKIRIETREGGEGQ